MAFSLEELKQDVKILNETRIFEKYILGKHNWYFENILDKTPEQIEQTTKRFKTIISNELNVDFANIIMVGSSKIGYSLSPPTQKENVEDKLFKAFCEDGKERKTSDIDVAIISKKMFDFYWGLLRESYRMKYEAFYKYIPKAIYRGYINEINLLRIDGCRKNWTSASVSSKKLLHSDLFICHEINYRLYRNWHDFEEYNLKALSKIKKEVS